MTLEVGGVRVAYGGVVALDRVSLEIGRGEVLGVVGPNGSGKTTLLNVLSGLTRPSSGEVFMDGAAITRLSPKDRVRQGLARTFQTPSFDPSMALGEAIRSTAVYPGSRGLIGSMLLSDWRSRGAQSGRLQSGEILEKLGLAKVAECQLGEVSLATLRLVEVARALMTGPRYLLCDEPAAGLDQMDRIMLSRVLRECASQGVGVLLIEHNVEFLRDTAGRMVAMDRGHVVAQGGTESLLASTEVRASYLGAEAELSKSNNGASPAPGDANALRPSLDRAPSQTGRSVLVVDELDAWYGPVRACSGMSLRLGRGDVLGITGPNGAGKSSFLGALAGTVGSRSGRVSLLGEELRGKPAWARTRLGLVFIPERRGNVLPELTSGDNLLVAASLRQKVAGRGPAVSQILEFFPGLRGRLSVLARQLSGGEQQILAIAMALLLDPKVLLMDEPSQGLAPVVISTISGAWQVIRERERSIVVVEQRVDLLQAWCDATVVMEPGGPLIDARPQEVGEVTRKREGLTRSSKSDVGVPKGIVTWRRQQQATASREEERDETRIAPQV